MPDVALELEPLLGFEAEGSDTEAEAAEEMSEVKLAISDDMNVL